jgi:hypothetical protein
MTQPNQSCPRCNRRHPLCPYCITLIKKSLLTLSVSEVANRFGFKIPTLYYYKREDHYRKEPQTPAEKSELGNCNRAEFSSFVKYYTARPYAFFDLFGYEPGNGNMRKAFDECKNLRLSIKFGEQEIIDEPNDGYMIVGLRGRERNEEGI